MLKQQDLNIAMMVTSREVLSALSQLVPCVGCRRSVERLFSQLVESGNPALEPLAVGPKGVLSVVAGVAGAVVQVDLAVGPLRRKAGVLAGCPRPC